MKLIIRIGSRVVDAKEIARPVETFKKDDIVTWAGAHVQNLKRQAN